MRRKIVSMILIVIAIGLGVCSWFLLPEVVTVQVGLDGQPTNTMPKLLAIAVPVGVSVVGSVMHLTIREKKNTKGFVLAVVGIAILILSLLFNR